MIGFTVGTDRPSPTVSGSNPIAIAHALLRHRLAGDVRLA